MQFTCHKNTLAAALALSLSAGAWSTASHACAYEPLISSVCTMAAVNLGGSFNNTTFVMADGRLLPISQYAALFALVGTTYGGDGKVNFGVPDLKGRVVMGSGTVSGAGVFNAGEKYGQYQTNLTIAQLPAHTHTLTTTTVNTSRMTATTTLSGMSGSLTGSLALKASTGGNVGTDPAGKSLATTGGTVRIYSDAAPTIAMNAASIDSSGLTVGNITGNATTTLGGTASIAGTTDVTGSSQAVSLMQPSLVMNYYIAVNGIFPTRD